MQQHRSESIIIYCFCSHTFVAFIGGGGNRSAILPAGYGARWLPWWCPLRGFLQQQQIDVCNELLCVRCGGGWLITCVLLMLRMHTKQQ